MIKKILLIIPSARQNEPSSFTVAIPTIAAMLRSHDFEVEIMDIEGYKKEFDDDYSIELVIQSSEFDAVGIGGMITSYKQVKRLIQAIRANHKNKPIILGGGLASSIPEDAINILGADYVVYGEGDLSMLNLLHSLNGIVKLKDVDGIYYKKGEKIIKNKPFTPIKDLDSLPRIAYDLMPMHKYINQFDNFFGFKKSITIPTSRGCVGQCSYCFRIFGKCKYTFNSAKWILDEVQYLQKKYGINCFFFSDEDFMLVKERVEKFCSGIRVRKMNIKWVCSSRVKNIDKPLCRLMKKCGCVHISLGLESGSQTILDNMKKGATVKDNENALNILRKIKLSHGGTMMFGHPGENDETLNETIAFCKRMNLDRQFFYTTPYPGTDIYNELVKAGRIKDKEVYYELLGDAKDFVINLTDWTDDELKHRKGWLQEQIKISFLKALVLRIKHKGFAMFGPQILYTIHGVLGDERCECGRTLPLISHIFGRQSDIFTLPDKSLVHGEFFTHLFYDNSDVIQFRLTQLDLDHFMLELVVGQNFMKRHEEQIISKLKKITKEQVEIEVIYKKEIKPLSSGKSCFTRSLVKIGGRKDEQ